MARFAFSNARLTLCRGSCAGSDGTGGRFLLGRRDAELDMASKKLPERRGEEPRTGRKCTGSRYGGGGKNGEVKSEIVVAGSGRS
jgi:hypothetical protein